MELTRNKKIIGGVAAGLVTVVALVGSQAGSEDSEPKPKAGSAKELIAEYEEAGVFDCQHAFEAYVKAERKLSAEVDGYIENGTPQPATYKNEYDEAAMQERTIKECNEDEWKAQAVHYPDVFYTDDLDSVYAAIKGD